MILQELAAHVPELVGLCVLLGFSAFFSGSETALFTLTRSEVRVMERASGRAERYIAEMLRTPQALLTVILFGNMVVNVAFYAVSFFITVDIARNVSAGAAAASGVASLLAVIIFGEVSPKGMAVGRPRWFARVIAAPLYLYFRALRPLGWLLQSVAQRVTGFLASRLPRTPNVSREELQTLVAMAEEQGVMQSDVRAMIHQVMALGTIRAREIMVPRVDVPMFDLNDDRGRLHDLIRRTGEERIPVYAGSRDNVIGMLVSRRVLLHPEKPIRELLEPVRFVPETQTLESLLRHFRETGDPVAVVVDEYGGTSGLVDLERVFEQVVGEIRDESESAAQPVRQIDADTYLLEGDLNAREWREHLGVSFDRPGVETVGGFVTALLGRIPRTGDTVVWRGLRFTVERMTGRRVDLVRVEREREEE